MLVLALHEVRERGVRRRRIQGDPGVHRRRTIVGERFQHRARRARVARQRVAHVVLAIVDERLEIGERRGRRRRLGEPRCRVHRARGMQRGVVELAHEKPRDRFRRRPKLLPHSIGQVVAGLAVLTHDRALGAVDGQPGAAALALEHHRVPLAREHLLLGRQHGLADHVARLRVHQVRERVGGADADAVTTCRTEAMARLDDIRERGEREARRRRARRAVRRLTAVDEVPAPHPGGEVDPDVRARLALGELQRLDEAALLDVLVPEAVVELVRLTALGARHVRDEAVDRQQRTARGTNDREAQREADQHAASVTRFVAEIDFAAAALRSACVLPPSSSSRSSHPPPPRSPTTRRRRRNRPVSTPARCGPRSRNSARSTSSASTSTAARARVSGHNLYVSPA